MNNVGEKYLPIGTVVMLTGGTKRVMITGFCSMPAEDGSEMFDYSGCMYPEGFLSSDQTALFNHNQISQIYHMGLIDNEEIQFKANLKTLVSQMNNTVQNNTVNASTNQQSSVSQLSQNSQPTVENIPPIGPGLPGYVAPAAPANTQQVSSQQGKANIQFDENGTVTSVN